YKEMETEVKLKNGKGSGYGLGIFISKQSGHNAISHGGEVSGFTAQNVVFPEERGSITVFTNQDAVSAARQIADRIAPLLFASGDASAKNTNNAKEQQAHKIFEGLQHGQIDRSLFTDNCNHYFSAQAIQDFASSLGPLGIPEEFVQTSQGERGGMVS